MTQRALDLREALVRELQRLYRREAARPWTEYHGLDDAQGRRDDRTGALHDWFAILPDRSVVLVDDAQARVPPDIVALADERPSERTAQATAATWIATEAQLGALRPGAQQPAGIGQRMRVTGSAFRFRGDLAVRTVAFADGTVVEQGFRSTSRGSSAPSSTPTRSCAFVPARRPDRPRTAGRRRRAPAARAHEGRVRPAAPALPEPAAGGARPRPGTRAAGPPARGRAAAVVDAGERDRRDRPAAVVDAGRGRPGDRARAPVRVAGGAAPRRGWPSARRTSSPRVSHELRTPLTSIRMYADLLKEGWVKDGADGAGLLRAHLGGERAARRGW